MVSNSDVLKKKTFTDLKFTHQTLSFHTHIVGAGVEAGRPVSGALGLTDVESIAGGSAGQLALLIWTDCNKRSRGLKPRTFYSFPSSMCVFTKSVWKNQRGDDERLSMWSGNRDITFRQSDSDQLFPPPIPALSQEIHNHKKRCQT